jgi:predicted ATPase/class 3 adenylate cyclase
MRPDLPTGTVTFLFTDIEGSTRLLHALGPDAYAEALAEHRRLLRTAFAAHDGVEVDTQGDAFFVAFPTAQGAAAAATEGLAALAPGPIRVRMGLHTGSPTVTGEGYVGVDVHRGARVAALAHGDQIVVSPATAALLDGHELRNVGQHRLKDFDGSIRLHQLGTGAFSPLRTPGSVDLPTPATRFLGRERELFQAVSLVYERDPRVLTILGPGGTGKTRFALELTRLLADEAEGGSAFVPLAPLRDPAFVLPTIGDRLGAGSGNPQAIATRIGDKRTHLLVDNLEHLLPDAARPLAELAAAAPALRLLATSRAPLRVSGEVELDLPPLAESDAVALFVDRAQAVRPELEADAAVSELCTRLDNLPLALELAAARTKLLSPEALLARLSESLDLLKGTRDADERHATLRATIAWSYDLLDPEEQRLFRRLSVFRGGCTLESAEAVCEADLDTLASLLDKSLVRRRTGRLGEERFWMLEMIREFAVEQLEGSGEADAIRRRHAERMLEIAKTAHLSEDDDQMFREEIALAERDDLRAALDWTAENDAVLGLELGCALETVWGAQAPAEGVRRFTQLLDRATDVPPRLRALALRNLAGAAHQLRDFDVAIPAYEASLRIFLELRDRRGVASVRTRLAWVAFARDDVVAAYELATMSDEDAVGRFLLVEAQNAILRTHIALSESRLDEAELDVTRASELLGGIGWDWHEAIALSLRLSIAVERGNVGDAIENGRRALAMHVAAEHAVPTMRGAMVTLASAAVVVGRLVPAGILWGAIERYGTDGFGPLTRGRAESLECESRPPFLEGVKRGRELEVWDAAAIALAELESPQTVP